MTDITKDSDFDGFYAGNDSSGLSEIETIDTPNEIDYSELGSIIDEPNSVSVAQVEEESMASDSVVSAEAHSSSVSAPTPRAALPDLTAVPVSNDRGSGIIFDASIEIFKKHGFAIQPTDEIYFVMQFLQQSMHSMHNKERADWRVMVDDAMSGMHEIRNEMHTVVTKQREEIGTLREEIESMRQRSIESINETMRQAQLGAEEYGKKITDAAEAQFKTSLRQLINTEMRVAISQSAQIEIDQLKKALADATAQAHGISLKLGGGNPNPAGSVMENLTRKFKALAPWQQGVGFALTFLLLAYFLKLL